MRSSKGGFLLIEVMFAVAVFSIAVVALVRCLGAGADAMRRSNHESALRLGIESRIAAAQAEPLALGVQKEKEDGIGITWETEWKPLLLTSQDKTVLSGLYRLTVRAHWTEEGTEEDDEVAVDIYRPTQ